jgi:hypothetical protein
MAITWHNRIAKIPGDTTTASEVLTGPLKCDSIFIVNRSTSTTAAVELLVNGQIFYTGTLAVNTTVRFQFGDCGDIQSVGYRETSGPNTSCDCLVFAS